MPIGIVGATLIAAGVGAAASIYASSQQAKAAQNALNTQTGMFQQAQAGLAPYRALGDAAAGSIAQLYGFPNPTTGAPGTGAPNYSAFTNSPDYKFAQEQGTLAVDRSAAAKGLLNSGGTLKDLTSFGQGLASQQYGNYFNRLATIAGLGQAAAGTGAQTATSFGQTIGNTQQNLGAAQASGAVGIANALSTLPQNMLYAQYFGQNANPSSYSAGSYPNALTPGQTANSLYPGSGSMAYGNIAGPYNGFGP